MLQVKTFSSEYDLNDWLEEHQNEYAVRDIKFGYCGTSSWTHEKFMVIYEKPSDEMPPLQDLLDEYKKQRKDWLDKDV